MILRVYIDTSVVGGLFDEEFARETIPFFEQVTNGELNLIISDLLEAELMGAPKFVKDYFEGIPKTQIEYVKLSAEATVLADSYISANVVGKTSKADCQHIAIATICRADVLVSWNFKHIVNLTRIRGYNGLSND